MHLLLVLLPLSLMPVSWAAPGTLPRGGASAKPAVDPRLSTIVSADVARDLPALVQRQRRLRTAAELAALWSDMKDWSTRCDEALDLWWNSPSREEDPSFMDQVVPGMELGVYAEGTVARLQHRQADWAAMAARTPETIDDAFFRLTAAGWDNASGTGWERWGERNWDYGGCSMLGSGRHLEILLAADAAKEAPAPWAAVVAELRTDTLLDIVEGHSEFPYCDIATVANTPEEKLRAEVQQILAQVKLDATERAALEGRLARGFAPPQ